MKRKRYSEHKIISILNEAENTGIKVKELCRKHGMSEQSYYRWKSKYGGMQVSELKRMKELEKENIQLKKIVADQALKITVLEDINSKNW